MIKMEKLNVSPEFAKRIRELKKKIMMKKGVRLSDRELTEQIAKSPDLALIEQKMLEDSIINIDFKIKFHGRGR